MLITSTCSLVVTKTPCTGMECNENNTNTYNGANDMDIKYGLVPVFLIGASSVIIIYIVMHCLYLHCYAKRKMQHMAAKSQANTTISLNNGHTSHNMQPVTPIVKYDMPYGKTEILLTTPFLVETRNKNQTQISKTSNIKNMFSKKSHKSSDRKQKNIVIQKNNQIHVHLPALRLGYVLYQWDNR